MPSLIPYPNHVSYPLLTNELFSLHINLTHGKLFIFMQLHQDIVNTQNLPHTYAILQKTLPTILRATCFNEGNIPFCKEVRRTEIGHLFEHILLEYLCKEKLLAGAKRAMFEGVTDWNWEKEPYGSFHITIPFTEGDADFFPIALKKSMQLLNVILKPSISPTIN